MSAGVTYQPSDLHKRYRAILREARAGQARVRDTDGTSILVLPERAVESLRGLAAAGANLAAVELALEGVVQGHAPGVQELGDWTWLRVFDVEDLRLFVQDVRQALIVGFREGDDARLGDELAAWRATAAVAADPTYCAILDSGLVESDFVEVDVPELPAETDTPAANASG